MQTKRLELQFNNLAGKRITLSVLDPKDNLLADDVETVMNQLIISNIFDSVGGDLVSIAGARIVTRDVTDLVAA